MRVWFILSTLADNEAFLKGLIEMNESTHVMLRLLSEDAGLGAPVEARYDHTWRKNRMAKATVKVLLTCIAISAVTILAKLG